jgi:uncharacterized protein YkwD
MRIIISPIAQILLILHFFMSKISKKMKTLNTLIIVLLFCFSSAAFSQVIFYKGGDDKIQAWQDHYTTLPNVAGCQEGTLKDYEKQQILNYVNFIRSIHNLQPVQYDLGGDEAAQKSALIQTANATLSHTPPTSASCYSQIGYYGSEKSNLFLYQMSQGSDVESKQSITGWMLDNNSANAVDRCGHRRAIINPFVTAISFGRVEGKANVGTQWCIGMALKYMDNVNGNIQGRPIDFVAYPYQAYPIELVDKSWYLSFSPFYDMTSWSRNNNVDYSGSQITITTEGGQPMNVHSLVWDDEGWGAVHNNIRWKVDNMQNEVKYLVSIKNINVNGTKKDYEYWYKLTNNIFNQKPATPLLTYPLNSATNMSLNLGFSWSVSEFTYQYQFQLATDFNFNNKIKDEKITANGYVAKDLAPTTTYYWRVKALNDIGESNWSDIYTFTTAAPKPDKPTLASPPNSSQNVAITPTLTWFNIPGAEKYQLQVAYKNDFSGFSVVVDKNDLQDSTYKIELGKLNPNTNYWWRVASIAQGQKSTYSSTWTFKTKDTDPAPESAILNSPKDNTQNVPYNPVLDWDDTPTATNYRVQVATSFNFKDNDLVINKNVSNSMYQVMAGELKALTNYFWKIQAYNEGGYAEWSQIWTFKTSDFSSVKMNEIVNGFSIAPNPVKNTCRIILNNEISGDLQIEVYDLLGNSLLKIYKENQGSNELLLDVASLTTGTYILKIQNNTKFSILKFEKM